MKIIEIHGNTWRFANGWHRYIVTFRGTKWTRILDPIKLHVIRVRNFQFDKLFTKDCEQNWSWYHTWLSERRLQFIHNEKRFAEDEVNKVLDWIEDMDDEVD